MTDNLKITLNKSFVYSDVPYDSNNNLENSNGNFTKNQKYFIDEKLIQSLEKTEDYNIKSNEICTYKINKGNYFFLENYFKKIYIE